IDFGAAVLSLRHVFRQNAEALISELRFCNADAIDVAGRKARGARKADVKGVQIGALAPEILRFQHETDVADAAAPGLWISESIFDDPLVDRASLLDVGTGAAHDFVRC